MTHRIVEGLVEVGLHRSARCSSFALPPEGVVHGDAVHAVGVHADRSAAATVIVVGSAASLDHHLGKDSFCRLQK